MEVILLLFLCLIVLVGFAIQFWDGRRRSLHEQEALAQKQKEIDLLRQQLSLSQNNDQSLLMKSQQTATSIDAMNRQFQTLFRELSQLGKDSALHGTAIAQIEGHVRAINQVMVNKKARGNWGEYQLGMLLALYAGDNREVYEEQFTLDNRMIADAVLHIPGSDRLLCIDSKFPLEYYQGIVESEQAGERQTRYTALFKTSIKKHIDDIAHKYITPQTSDQAVMFVPSEAIYTYICSQCSDLLEYSYQKHVLMTSPTTLIGVVFTMVHATKDVRRSEHVRALESEIRTLSEDAGRLMQRLEKSEKALEQSMSLFSEAQTSARKITRRIEKISDGDIS